MQILKKKLLCIYLFVSTINNIYVLKMVNKGIPLNIQIDSISLFLFSKCRTKMHLKRKAVTW